MVADSIFVTFDEIHVNVFSMFVNASIYEEAAVKVDSMMVLLQQK